jgi:hypothetical protein
VIADLARAEPPDLGAALGRIGQPRGPKPLGPGSWVMIAGATTPKARARVTLCRQRFTTAGRTGPMWSAFSSR